MSGRSISVAGSPVEGATSPEAAAEVATPAPRGPLRRAFGVTLGLGVALGIVGGSHFYIAKRFFLDPGWPQPWTGVGVAVVALGFASFFALPAVERKLDPPLSRRLALPIVVWMGVLWLSFAAWALADGAGALMELAGATSGDAPTRALVVGFVVIAAAVYGLSQGLRLPRVRRQEIALANWPEALDGFRIAQISDIHIGPVLDRRFAEGLTAAVNGLGADLVVVTGDLVDGGVDQLKDDVAPFGELRAPEGVFFITGNHDIYSGDVAWVAHVRTLGMKALRNDRVAIGGPAGFDLAGVDDHRGDWRTSSTEDLGAALDGRDPERPVILLAHDPSTFKRAQKMGVDLQISGHTHGGQIWPFHGLVRLVNPWVQGLHRVGASQIWVSRGSGFWGPPMRLFAPSEISELVIRRAPLA